jgi:hypothetical protein
MLDPLGLYIPENTADCTVKLFPPVETRYGQRNDVFDPNLFNLVIPFVAPTGAKSYDTLGCFDVSLHWRQWILWDLWQLPQNYLYICTEKDPCGNTRTDVYSGNHTFKYEKLEGQGVDRWRDVRFIPPPNNPPTNLPPPWIEWGMP